MLYSKIEGEGQPLLILHGFLGMLDNWKTLGYLRQKVSSSHAGYVIDGRSIQSEEFSYKIMAKDIYDYNNLSNDLIGHSMGGKTAMLFAATHPEIVDKMIIADIGPKFYPQHHQSILAGLNA
jgi:pimeloyl-ACP methyl ester carboxylesterase